MVRYTRYGMRDEKTLPIGTCVRIKGSTRKGVITYIRIGDRETPTKYKIRYEGPDGIAKYWRKSSFSIIKCKRRR